jgi:hypothetical protein
MKTPSRVTDLPPSPLYRHRYRSVTDVRPAWEEVLEVAEPEWFFDDELSRLRLKWAASMREPDVVAVRGRGRRIAPGATHAPAPRVVNGDEHAAWTSVRRDQQHLDQV